MIEHSAVDVPARSAESADDVGPFSQRNTPSPAGYLLAAFSALFVGSVLVPLALGAGGGNASDFSTLVGAVLTFGLLVAMAIGFPLTMIAHVALRSVQRQSLHIAVFGVVGLLTGYLVQVLLFHGQGFPLLAVVAVGVSTAAGRVVVNRRPR